MDCDRKVSWLSSGRSNAIDISINCTLVACMYEDMYHGTVWPMSAWSSCFHAAASSFSTQHYTLTTHTTTCTYNGPYARISLCVTLQHVLDALSLSLSHSLYTLTIQLPLTFGLCLETTQPGSYGAFSQQPIMYPSA